MNQADRGLSARMVVATSRPWAARCHNHPVPTGLTALRTAREGQEVLAVTGRTGLVPVSLNWRNLTLAE
jgi:hypothetical protein